jgi:hypothetical protein
VSDKNLLDRSWENLNTLLNDRYQFALIETRCMFEKEIKELKKEITRLTDEGKVNG